MRFHLLENPSAGRTRVRLYLDAVVGSLRGDGHEVTTYRSRNPGDLVRHVAELDRDAFDRLLVAGGDGTVRGVINARPGDWAWPLGILPVGTANLSARETGMLPLPEPEGAARSLVDADPWSVDLLEIKRDGATPEWALAVVSTGIDADVVHAVTARRSRGAASGGYAQWAGHTWPALRDFDASAVEVSVDDGAPRTCSTAIVQNAHAYAGMLTLAPQARLDSGFLDVVSFFPATVRDAARLLVRAAFGRLPQDRQARIRRGRHVRLRSRRPRAVQADGDPAGFTDLEVTLRPGALRLLRAEFARRSPRPPRG